MKNLITIVCLLIAFNSFSQEIAYMYDNVGNRVKRLIILVPSGLAQASTSSASQNTENLTLEEKQKDVAQVDSVKILDSKDNFSFTIFPNPTLAEITVLLDKDFLVKESKEIAIYDEHGTFLERQKINDSKLSLNLSKYASGKYFVRLTAANFSHEWVVVKE